MGDSAWRQRLAESVKKSGRSKRSLSLETGNGPGYVYSIIDGGKDPTIENLLAVCRVLNVSAAYIIHGVDVSDADAELLRLIQDNPERRNAILALIGASTDA